MHFPLSVKRSAFWVLLAAALFLFYATIGSGRIRFPFGLRYAALGETLALIGISALLLIYLRSAIKLALNKHLLDRIGDQGVAILGRAQKLLTRYHPYIGATAAFAIIGHCIAISNFFQSPYLRTVFTLIAIQAVFGSIMKAPWTPVAWKARVFAWHANLTILAVIGLLAALGHAIVFGVI